MIPGFTGEEYMTGVATDTESSATSLAASGAVAREGPGPGTVPGPIGAAGGYSGAMGMAAAADDGRGAGCVLGV